MKRATKLTIPEEWKVLFLAVADMVDGDFHNEFRASLLDAYEKVWKAGGRKIYYDAIEDQRHYGTNKAL